MQPWLQAPLRSLKASCRNDTENMESGLPQIFAVVLCSGCKIFRYRYEQEKLRVFYESNLFKIWRIL